MNTRYAVVRDVKGDYRFSSWHDSLESAKTEAERLCQKDKVSFIVLKTVGAMKFKSVQWEGEEAQVVYPDSSLLPKHDISGRSDT